MKRISINIISRLLKVLSVMLLLSLSFSLTYAQSAKIVKGEVVDEHGEALVGVSIFSTKDSKVGTATDLDGKFTLRINGDSHKMLVVSMIGMETKLIEVSEKYQKVVLEVSSEISESIVTGYAPKSKNSFTGTATQVRGEDLMKVNPTSVLEALEVFDPSFVISDMGGEFGSNPNHVPGNIEIRGSNSLPDISENNLQTYTSLPIFIMDGFQIDVEKVFNLDMSRVESVTILKDAAASSIYGSRAANGVIVIVTKTPKSGAVQVSYTTNVSVETPDLSSYNLMNSKELVDYYSRLDVFTEGGDPDKLNLLQMLSREAENGVDTYWLSQPLRTSINHTHSLFLEGGMNVGNPSQKRSLRYQANLNGNFANGVMKGSGRDNFGGGVKLLFDTKNLQVTSDLQINFMENDNSPYGSFATYTQLLPIYRIYDERGNLFPMLSATNIPMYDNYPWTSVGSRILGEHINPLYEATQLNSYSRGESMSVSYQLGANWEIIEDLRLRANFTYNRNQTKNENYVSPMTSSFVTGDADNSIEDIYRRGSYDATQGANSSYYGMANLSYMKNFNKHTVQAIWGGEIKEDLNENDSYRAVGFVNDIFDYPSDAVQYPTNGRPSGYSTIVRSLGTFLTANYSYDDRYMVDASYRLDASSNFASKKRVSDFWAVGLRWNLSSERFMSRNFFDNIAIKANMGTTGNSNFALSQIMNMYLYSGNYDGITSAELQSLANENLKWQTTLKRNVGVELAMWDRRVNLDFNLYRNTTRDNITQVSILPSTGFPSFTANQGDVENKGIDFNISVTPLRTKDWSLNLFVNGQHNRNKLTNLSEALKDYNQSVMDNQLNSSGTKIDNVFLFEENKSISSIYAVPSLGIDPGTGQEIFLTKSGERTFDWNPADQVVVGDTEADLRGYFGLNLSYKAWSLNTSFEYSFGGQMYNQTLVNRIENTSINSSSSPMAYNMDRRALYDRWFKPSDIAKYKSANAAGRTYSSSRFVQNNNYLRMNSIRLMYNISPKNKRILGMTMLRISLTMNDLFYASTIEQERGLSYPYARTTTLGIQANF